MTIDEIRSVLANPEPWREIAALVESLAPDEALAARCRQMLADMIARYSDERARQSVAILRLRAEMDGRVDRVSCADRTEASGT